MEMREFTKFDWLSFAGASKFDDGSNPLIAEYGPLTVVIAKFGMEVYVGDDCYLTVEVTDKQYCIDVAKSILEQCKSKTPKQMVRVLNEMN